MGDIAHSNYRREPPDYETLTAILRAFEASHPDLMRLESAGTTPGGRELWVAVVGREPNRVRPAAWIDGNMHASELAGTSVCLAVIDDLLALLSGDDGVHSSAVADVIREGLFYVMPRMSPDGAEAVLKTTRYVRSVGRPPRDRSPASHWQHHDVDGDGRALIMRLPDPGGEFVESPDRPGLMVLREVDDPGPYYKIYPEGSIANFDGVNVPSPDYLSDNDPDLNRNFPYSWAPEPQQRGAGPFPMSEVESRSVVEYTAARPHLHVWLNLHCFGGVHIRPSGSVRDTAMNPYDRAVFTQLGEWAESITGYPMVSGFEEFTYVEGQALHGDLLDYAYEQRGCLAWVCELWDIFEQLAFAKPQRFVDRYTHMRREDYGTLYDWDRRHNAGRIFQPWVPSEHPQLGPVEVGGLDPRFGIWNPPPEELEEICRRQSELFVRAASLVPRARLSARVEDAEGDLQQVVVTVENHGYLPTNGMQAASSRPHCGPLALEFETTGAAYVIGPKRFEVEHLGGWGHGRGSGFGSLFHQRSAGSAHRREIRVLVRGEGAVQVKLESSRTGSVQTSVRL
ncbi:MAG: M14 family metallopeptidase [Myxococcota bacterium]